MLSHKARTHACDSNRLMSIMLLVYHDKFELVLGEIAAPKCLLGSAEAVDVVPSKPPTIIVLMQPYTIHAKVG
jgi:hypothetical protein